MSESWILLIPEVVAWMLVTYCGFKFSVSSNFILISACSKLYTSFRKSMPGSRTDDGCDALFLFQFCVIVVLESSLRVRSFFLFCNYWGNMVFVLEFQFLLRVVFIVSLGILRISFQRTLCCCLFFWSQTFKKILVWVFFQLKLNSMGRNENIF